MNVKGVSTIVGLASESIGKRIARCYPYSTYWQPLWAKEKATWSQPHSENERQQRVINFGCCILYNPRAVLQLVPLIGVLGSLIVNMINIDVATPKNDCQQNVNNFGCCIWHNPRAKLRLLCIIIVLAACIGNVVNVVFTA